MPNVACFYFLQSAGFLFREAWLNNISLCSGIMALMTEGPCWNFGGPSRAPRHPRQRGGAGSERRRRANPPCTAVLVCSHRRENHLFPLERGLVPHALPPASRLRPQLPCFDEQWGNESPALKILWFYLDKKKTLACLHWHTKIVLVWVNLQSFSPWKYLASLFLKLII